MALDMLESFSEPREQKITTAPSSPSGLKLETSTPSSLRVKWEPPVGIPTNLKMSYSLSINAEHPDVQDKMEKHEIQEKENPVYNFSHLPEVIGSGQRYEVSVRTMV